MRPSPEDMRVYREKVRGVLEPHFVTDPTLRKLRHGEPLLEADFTHLALWCLRKTLGWLGSLARILSSHAAT